MTVNYRNFIEEGQTAPITGVARPYRVFGKRVLDIFLVLLAAPFVVPLVALLAVIVASDGGKPFYLQSRVAQVQQL